MLNDFRNSILDPPWNLIVVSWSGREVFTGLGLHEYDLHWRVHGRVYTQTSSIQVQGNVSLILPHNSVQKYEFEICNVKDERSEAS